MTAQVCPNGAKRTKHHKQRPCILGRTIMNYLARIAVLNTAILLFAGTDVFAHDAEGTLEKIARTGEFVIGYRTDAMQRTNSIQLLDTINELPFRQCCNHKSSHFQCDFQQPASACVCLLVVSALYIGRTIMNYLASQSRTKHCDPALRWYRRMPEMPRGRSKKSQEPRIRDRLPY